MGLKAQIALVWNFGEWSLYAQIRALLADSISLRQGLVDDPLQAADLDEAIADCRAQHIFTLDDEAFVRSAYARELGREPDPTGLAGHLSALRSGASHADILERLSSSEEALLKKATAFVEDAYLEVLGRNVDPSGFTYFLRLMREGKTRAEILELLRSSDEAKAKQTAALAPTTDECSPSAQAVTDLENYSVPHTGAWLRPTAGEASPIGRPC